jgi:phenylalanyl-tRNA synthetase beta chain
LCGSGDDGKDFGVAPSDAKAAGEGEAGGRAVVVANPLSSQHSIMRQSLIGSLLDVVSANLRQGREDVAIFEIGKGYGATGDGATHEWWRLGLAMTGPAEIPAWNRPARPYDLDDAKGCSDFCPYARRADTDLRR